MIGLKLYLANTVHFLFACYTVMIFIYILSSWVPQLRGHTVMRFVGFYTEPYLQVFRRLIPPIGGMLDLSPILAFFGLKLLEPLFIQLIYWIF